MRNEWILDVLADLQTFASDNGLNVLAETLHDTRCVAVTELTLTEEGKSGREHGPARAAGASAVGCRTGL